MISADMAQRTLRTMSIEISSEEGRPLEKYCIEVKQDERPLLVDELPRLFARLGDFFLKLAIAHHSLQPLPPGTGRCRAREAE